MMCHNIPESSCDPQIYFLESNSKDRADKDLGCRVQGSGFRLQGSKLGVQGLVCSV